LYIAVEIPWKYLLNIFRQDKEGFKKAQLEHRQSAEQYLNITLKWANTNEEIINSDRINAIKYLSDSFKQLIPYIFPQKHIIIEQNNSTTGF
jgi:hypothetical protein